VAGLDDQHCPIAILDIGRVHFDPDPQITDIGQDVALRPLTFLAIITPRPAEITQFIFGQFLSVRA
jgi:hypothetical protein